jgi:hypothetical protein
VQKISVRIAITHRAQRSCAALLLALFVILILAPFAALTQDPEASLPICCRTHGAHHCTMRRADRDDLTRANSEPIVTALSEKCPYAPFTSVTAHRDMAGPGEQPLVFAGFALSDAVRSQDDTAWRLVFNRSHPQRGPPQHLLLA